METATKWSDRTGLPTMDPAAIGAEEEAVRRGQEITSKAGGSLRLILIRKQWDEFVEQQEKRRRLLDEWIYAADLCREEACAWLGPTARLLRKERFQNLDEKLGVVRVAWAVAWDELEAAARKHEEDAGLHTKIFKRGGVGLNRKGLPVVLPMFRPIWDGIREGVWRVVRAVKQVVIAKPMVAAGVAVAVAVGGGVLVRHHHPKPASGGAGWSRH